MSAEPKPATPEVSGARPFTDVMRDLERGGVVAEASTAFCDLIGRVRETGKGGSLTLKINVKPHSGVDTETVDVTADIKVAAPQPSRVSTLFFITGDDNLTRRDPRQMDIEDRLHPVEGV